MSEMSQFVAHDIETFIAPSEHFGVSVDSCISSLPIVGMEATRIAQDGLAISLSQRKFITANFLLHGPLNYDLSTVPQARNITRMYHIPDAVCEFAESRKIDPLLVIRAGANLLQITAAHSIPVESKMPVRRIIHRPSAAKLDSFLQLSISPIDTIIPNRTRPTLTEKIFKN